MMGRIKDFAIAIAGVALIVGLIVLYNFINPTATVPELEGRYWAGYYNAGPSGQVWCLARFRKSGNMRTMFLLPEDGPVRKFSVSTNSSDETFRRLSFSEDGGNSSIEAKQLYLGRRYILGRLTVGRFTDFWESNQDVSIHGTYSPPGYDGEFAIEPLPNERLLSFVSKYLKGQPAFANESAVDALIGLTPKGK